MSVFQCVCVSMQCKFECIPLCMQTCKNMCIPICFHTYIVQRVTTSVLAVLAVLSTTITTGQSAKPASQAPRMGEDKSAPLRVAVVMTFMMRLIQNAPVITVRCDSLKFILCGCCVEEVKLGWKECLFARVTVTFTFVLIYSYCVSV